MRKWRSIDLIGSITGNPVWLNVEVRPASTEPHKLISFGKTYHGTIAGILAKWGRVIGIGHLRK